MGNETISVVVEDFSPNYVFRDHSKEFSEKSGIEVKLEMYSEEELRKKMTNDILNHEATYDVLLLTKQEHSLYAKSSALVDLSSLINDRKYTSDQEARSIMKDIYPSFLRYNLWDKKLVGIPYSGEGNIFFYRKDLFKNARIKVPRTMPELAKAAKRLHHPKDQVGIVMRGMAGYGLNMFVFGNVFFKAWGARWFDEKWRPKFDSKQGVRALEFYANLLQKYGPGTEAAGMNWDRCWSIFKEGKAAMFIDGGVYAPGTEDPNTSSVAGSVGYSTVPRGSISKPLSGLYVWSFAINRDSTKTRASWEWIKWASSKDMVMRSVTEQAHGTVARRSVVADPEYVRQFPYNDWIATENRVRRSGREMRPMIGEYTEIGDRLGLAVHNAVEGSESPTKALKSAATDVHEIMEKAGYYK